MSKLLRAVQSLMGDEVDMNSRSDDPSLNLQGSSMFNRMIAAVNRITAGSQEDLHGFYKFLVEHVINANTQLAGELSDANTLAADGDSFWSHSATDLAGALDKMRKDGVYADALGEAESAFQYALEQSYGKLAEHYKNLPLNEPNFTICSLDDFLEGYDQKLMQAIDAWRKEQNRLDNSGGADDTISSDLTDSVVRYFTHNLGRVLISNYAEMTGKKSDREALASWLQRFGVVGKDSETLAAELPNITSPQSLWSFLRSAVWKTPLDKVRGILELYGDKQSKASLKEILGKDYNRFMAALESSPQYREEFLAKLTAQTSPQGT